jgi:phosphatidylinositol alpha-mannosyltransferase
MKIAQICPYNLFRAGGVQTHVKYLAQELRLQGHDVKIIAPGTDGAKCADKNIILLGKLTEFGMNKTQTDFSLALGKLSEKIKKVLLKEKFDILHFHEPWLPALSYQILVESRGINIATIHSSTPDNFVGKSIEFFLMPFASTVLNEFDSVIAVSNAASKYLKEFYKGEVCIVPNGIDLSVFNPQNKPFDKFEDGKINILFLGRLDKRKGCIYLLKAFRKLKARFENVRLLIAGKGDQLKNINKYITKHDIPDVEMLGFVSEEDKPRIYASCDIYCSPALYGESFGIVLLEAMATGRPVVAYSNPGYKDVIKGTGALFLVKPKKVDALAAKLETLCRDKNLRGLMSKWGLKEAKKYSWDKVCDGVIKVYKNALERDKRKEGKEEKKRKVQEWFEKLG